MIFFRKVTVEYSFIIGFIEVSLDMKYWAPRSPIGKASMNQFTPLATVQKYNFCTHTKGPFDKVPKGWDYNEPCISLLRNLW